MVNKKKDVVEYNLTFVGANKNQAELIQGVIQAITEMKSKDTMPIKKYKGEIDKFQTDLNLFKDTVKALSKTKANKKLLGRLNERIEFYEKEIGERELKIDNHKENIQFVDDYIAKIRSHITEDINKEEKHVTYTYDMTYLEGLLDLALIVFELDFNDEKVS